MGWKNDDSVVIDVRIEHTTAKAHLVELQEDGRQFWLPKSQVHFMGEADEDGYREMHISDWIAGKNNISADR